MKREKIVSILMEITSSDMDDMILDAQSDCDTFSFEQIIEGQSFLFEGCATITTRTYRDDGGEYEEHDVDFDVIISTEDDDGDEVIASFCTMYKKPKIL